MAAMPIYDIGEFGIFWIPPYFVPLSITFRSEIPFFWEIHTRISQLIQSGFGPGQGSDRYPEFMPLNAHVSASSYDRPHLSDQFPDQFWVVSAAILRYSCDARGRLAR
jgi:hypothetical protein